jgi:hypothetical protein
MSISMQQYWILFGIIVVVAAIIGFAIAKWIVKDNSYKSMAMYVFGGAVIGVLIAAALNFIPNFINKEKKDAIYAPVNTIITPEAYIDQMRGLNLPQ